MDSEPLYCVSSIVSYADENGVAPPVHPRGRFPLCNTIRIADGVRRNAPIIVRPDSLQNVLTDRAELVNVTVYTDITEQFRYVLQKGSIVLYSK